MLSDELGSLSDWCLGIAAMGGQLTPDQLADMAKRLLDLAGRARRLELLPFDPHTIQIGCRR